MQVFGHNILRLNPATITTDNEPIFYELDRDYDAASAEVLPVAIRENCWTYAMIPSSSANCTACIC
jgi:hypothetical protein